MRKKKIRSIVLGISAIACAVTMSIGAINLHTADAAVTEQTVYADDFNTAALSDVWTATDANIVSEYSSLRIQPTEYSWPAHILCQAYKLEGDCRLEVKTQRLPSDGEAWYALSFGSPNATTSIFEKASGALIFSNGVTQLFKNGANTQTMFTYSPFSIDVATIVLEFSQQTNGTYDITYIVKDGDEVVGTPSKIEDFEVQDGYFGFNSYGVDFDVLSFEVYEGDEKVYADDFSSSKMSYNNNVVKNAEWVALTPFTTETASIAPVGQLDLSKIGASVVYNEAFETKSTEVSTLYEMSATFDFSKATVGTATGFEVAKSSVEASGVFVGIKRGFTGYELVLSDGESTDQKSLESNPADGIFNMSVVARYDNTLVVTVNGQSEAFSVSTTEGYWGITCAENYASSGKGALVDDFSFQRTVYTENSVADMGMNFEGTREFEDEDGKYYTYYVPLKDWYLGSNVRLANYDFAESGYALFGNASTDSSFGPKTKFNDCIVRFDVTMVGSDYYYDNPEDYFNTPTGAGACDAECFGLQFGSDSYKNLYTNAQSLGIATYNGKSIYYTTNCTRTINVDNEIVYIPNSERIASNEYDLFKKSVTYNFMYIIKDGTVTMHFKEASEPESVLGIVRERVTGVKTNGYVAVYGANGVDFRLDNFSVTNLERTLTSSAYNGGEDLQTLRVDLSKGDTLSAFNQTNNTLTTKGVVGSHIARFTLGDVDGLTYSQGNLNIAFTANGATVSDGIKTEEVVFGMPLLYNGATVEIYRVADEITIAFANAGTPLASLDENIYSVKGLQYADRESIKIATDGRIALSKIALFNLDSKTTMVARNFDAATDITSPWVERENIQGKDMNAVSSEESGCGSVMSLSAVLALLPIVWILVKKERENA